MAAVRRFKRLNHEKNRAIEVIWTVNGGKGKNACQWAILQLENSEKGEPLSAILRFSQLNLK